MMKIYAEEIKEEICSTPLKRDQIVKFIPEEIIKIINFNVIEDKFIYRPKTKYKHFESITISKFLQSEDDIFQILKKIVTIIECDFLIYIDFDGVFKTPSKETKDSFKFEFASKNTSINENFKIVSLKTASNLLSEFENKSHAEIVNKHFETHSKILDFVSSGFRPYMLLSMKIYIQTL